MRLAILVILASIVPVSPIHAIDLSFETVADTTTPVPSSSGIFTSFSTPSIGFADVAFEGFGSSGERGIYARLDGTLIRVADVTTALPGGIGNFIGFLSPPCVGDGSVAFSGAGSSAQRGIYDTSSGTLGVVVDRTDPVPGGGGSFITFAAPACQSQDVAFTASATFPTKVILSNVSGTLSLIESNSGPLSSFGLLSMASTQVGITAAGDSAGEVFALRGSSSPLITVANHMTSIPAGVGTFTGFEDASISGGGQLAFIGEGSFGQRGIYANSGPGGELEFIASLTFGPFTTLETPSYARGWLTFVGQVGGAEGLYLHHEGSIEKVIAVGDPLDGSTVISLNVGRHALHVARALHITFGANLANGLRGVWIASSPPLQVLPALSDAMRLILMVALVGSALSALALRSRRDAPSDDGA